MVRGTIGVDPPYSHRARQQVAANLGSLFHPVSRCIVRLVPSAQQTMPLFIRERTNTPRAYTSISGEPATAQPIRTSQRALSPIRAASNPSAAAVRGTRLVLPPTQGWSAHTPGRERGCRVRRVEWRQCSSLTCLVRSAPKAELVSGWSNIPPHGRHTVLRGSGQWRSFTDDFLGLFLFARLRFRAGR
ncbi:hypothetical protein VUR80DRAFT_4115 [Thermomyces stellatus]